MLERKIIPESMNHVLDLDELPGRIENLESLRVARIKTTGGCYCAALQSYIVIPDGQLLGRCKKLAEAEMQLL